MGFFLNVVSSIVGVPISSGNSTTSTVWEYLNTQAQLTNSFRILSGVTLVLIGCCWCSSYRWSKRPPNERSFTVLGCCSIFLIILLVCCTVVMSVLLYANNTLIMIMENENYSYGSNLFFQSLAVFILGIVFMTFLVCSCFCCCCWECL